MVLQVLNCVFCNSLISGVTIYQPEVFFIPKWFHCSNLIISPANPFVLLFVLFCFVFFCGGVGLIQILSLVSLCP